VQTLASADSSQWRGAAADAFRAHLGTEVLPLARKAAESVGKAASALHSWSLSLASLREQAQALDREAAPYNTTIVATQQAAAPTATSWPPGASDFTPAQSATLTAANDALSGITARANALHGEYLTAVQQTGSQLEDAGQLAPGQPGLFSQLWHDATSVADGADHLFQDFVHDKALWEFVSGIAGIVATVAGVLALFPPLSVIFAPITVIAAGVALVSDFVLAEFDGGSWDAVALDAVATVTGMGWVKAADELTEVYRTAGLAEEMTKAPTWAGVAAKVPLVTRIPVVGKAIAGAEQSVEVAPGMFRIIGASLKEAAGDSKEMNMLSSVKDIDEQGVWRGLDIFSGGTTWAFSGAGIEAIPGNVRTWVNDLATGQAPWNQTADAPAG
jgi:hypothetical protein